MIIEDNFITQQEVEEVLKYSPPELAEEIDNIHIREVYNATKGCTVLCDLTKTELSKQISKLQGNSTVVETMPEVFTLLADRIGRKLKIPSDHVFVQYIKLGENGKVAKHYDVGIPGYITYKCNICIKGPSNDAIYVGKDRFPIENFDLYCFEANLFKHWMEQSEEQRIHLSFGFLIPYEALDWNEDSPRVRLSNRLFKAYFSKM